MRKEAFLKIIYSKTLRAFCVRGGGRIGISITLLIGERRGVFSLRDLLQDTGKYVPGFALKSSICTNKSAR